jgi:hypothetical protein
MKATVPPSLIKIDEIHCPEVPDYRSNKGDDCVNDSHLFTSFADKFRCFCLRNSESDG